MKLKNIKMEVVICFSRIKINILSAIISIFIIVAFLQLVKGVNLSIENKAVSDKNKKIEVTENVGDLKISGENNVELEENILVEEFDWAIKIPKIDLYAQIEEGTTPEILSRSVGHFENTEIKIGNVGLASHNRGYEVNYFSRLKELEVGDDVIYIVNGNEKKYKINEILVIYETDWKMLENTTDNRLTLITCIENRDKYRLCVQAVEV